MPDGSNPMARFLVSSVPEVEQRLARNCALIRMNAMGFTHAEICDSLRVLGLMANG